MNELRRLTSDNPRQQLRLAQLEALLDENVALIENQRGSSGGPQRASCRLLVRPPSASRKMADERDEKEN